MERTEALKLVDDMMKFYLKKNTDCDPLKVMMAVECVKLGPPNKTYSTGEIHGVE